MRSSISTTVKKVANNTAYQLVGKVISMTITIGATVIVARYYGRESYGEFSLMQNIPALFFIIVDFGLNAISTRELSKDFKNAEKYFGNILIMRVAVSVFLMLSVGLALRFFPYSVFPYSDSLKFGLYLSLFLILTQALYSTTNVIFQVKLRYDLSNIGYVLGSIVILALVLLSTYMRLSIAWVNFSYVIGGFVTFFINLYLISKFINLRQSIHIDKSVIRYLSMQSLPLGLMFIFSQVNFKADSILLSSLLPSDASKSQYGLSNIDSVAIYNLPYKVFEVALVVPTFLMNAVYPIFVRHIQESRDKFLSTFYKTTGLLFLFGVIGAIVGYILSPWIIYTLGDNEFSQSVSVLRLLLIGLPIFYVTQPISWLIVTLENQKVLPYIYLIAAVFNLVLNFVYIPKYSFYASSSLTWLSEILILVFLVIFAIRTLKKD